MASMSLFALRQQQSIIVGKDNSITLNGKNIGTAIGRSFNNIAEAVKFAKEKNLMIWRVPDSYVVYAVQPEKGCKDYFETPSSAERTPFLNRELFF